MLEPSVSINKNISHSLGRIISFQPCENGAIGSTDQANFKVIVYAANTVKIHITYNDAFDEDSYAVIATPSICDFNFKEEGEQWHLSLPKVDLYIKKNPARFIFTDKKGTIINEDDPGFGTSRIGEQITTYKKLQPDERFIGLGEKTGPLDRKGHGYQHWNTDHFGYTPESDPLYCSTPFYIGVHSNLAYGIFLDNSHKTHFNFGASNNRFSSFSADSGDMSYYFIYEETVGEIISAYTDLTGRMSLPPLWSLGYQQCRYSYYPDKEVTSVAQTFRDKQISADVIVLDIHYMDKYKIFTWDGERFSNPKAMIDDLRSKGFHVVVMCDPGIKIEDGYEPYHSGIENDIFIKYPDNSLYSGEVWPGWCHFPDFTNSKARDWWKKNMALYTQLGLEGFWNDMNEIATWGQVLPELIEFDFEGNKGTARKGRNVYGMQMARSTYEGTKALLGNKRPFNLTRAGFSGIQRYAAVWTGDNVANDEHMLLGVRLVNSMGLAGIPFAGYDVGGFVGNASEHLFARWIQIGAFSPFFRGHSMINSRDSEPWAFGEEVEEISRNYIKLRYKLMPYFYSLFQDATECGLPIVRSLAIEYTHNSNIYKTEYENQYTLGSSILVAPVESTKHLTKVYLPKGGWYELFTDRYYDGNQEVVAECPIEQLPLFVKASSIIPLYPEAGSNTQEKGETLELHIYKGEQECTFNYYEDDGTSYDFENGMFYCRKINYNPIDKEIMIGEKMGSYKSIIKSIKLSLHGFENTTFSQNKQSIEATNQPYQFIDPISNFDPIDQVKEHKLKIDSIQIINLTNNDEETVISW